MVNDNILYSNSNRYKLPSARGRILGNVRNNIYVGVRWIELQCARIIPA